MPVQKYENYLEVNPNFESVVDLAADSRNADLWKEYIVGDDMVNLVEFLCQSLGNESPDARRSFWVHGSYGTGKSYAAIFVKHLLEEKREVIDEFMSKNSSLAPLRTRFLKCRKNENGEYLVIWKTGVSGVREGDMMLLEMEKAVRDALLAKFGDKADLGSASLLDVVKEKLNDGAINWENVMETTTLGDDYGNDFQALREKVNAGDLNALKSVAKVIRQRGWGLLNNWDAFKKWIADVIDANGLSKSGIFFIWDEFTEYVTQSGDTTILQTVSEFCKEKPFFMLYVVHRTDALVDNMGKEIYQKITDRFRAVEFHISADASYNLIAQSFHARPNAEEYWNEERKAVVDEIRTFLPEMEGLDDKITKKIDELCPVHPMTVKLLARVSESYAASQRTLFRFMKDQSVPDQGFIGYIKKYGPDDQAKWLTAEWLWDYFFTRQSDVSDSDKDKKAEFIRHYEENKHLVEGDESTFRVFKIAMLLLAVMSSTRGLYGSTRTRPGEISATVDFLKSCLAGTMTAEMVDEKLEILEDDKLVNRDAYGNVVRLQLPYKQTGDEFDKRLADNDKKFSRYQMFVKDGAFSTLLEDCVLNESDVTSKRIKAAACCAEVLSMKNRLEEIQKELDKAPHKLGLLLVTVKSDEQANSIQADLARKAQEGGERLIIALVRTPFTDEKRKEWLTRMTHMQLATDAGRTSSANGFKAEMEAVVNTWVGLAENGKLIAWHGTQVFNGLTGFAHLRKTIATTLMPELFPYAPETIVNTNTAYKSCNKTAPLAGIQRETKNSQLTSVLNGMKAVGILDASNIQELERKDGNAGAKAMAALARLVDERMTSGNVKLNELWAELQKKPFGYYDSIACGILLGYVFSFYKNSAYSWTDSAQATHILNETNLTTMVVTMCKGKLSTDYLSAGSVVFQNFRDYAKEFFGLSDVQVANETECWRNTHEAITKSGAPLWALKYLDDEAYINADYKQTTLQVVDALQRFVSQDSEREAIMREVPDLMQGRAKVRVIIRDSFKDKAVLAAAFRRFLFASSPDLQAIAEKLKLQPEPLNDKLSQVMQGAIYTWTEEQVREKLGGVVREYRFLDALNAVIGADFHDISDARRELKNVFGLFRISMGAVEKLNPAWFGALRILRREAENASRVGVAAQTAEEQDQEAEIAMLRQYGKDAMSALRDAKPVLSEILESRKLDCTKDELESVYQGLKSMTYDTQIGAFENALKAEMNKIQSARMRIHLQNKWESLTGLATVKDWCVQHKAPIQWIVPREYLRAIQTVMELQQGQRAADQQVGSALQALEKLDVDLMTDDAKIEKALLETIGAEYREIWQEQRDLLVSEARQKISADMSAWGATELSSVQRMLKKAQQEKAKKEKLAATKASVNSMAEASLRSKIAAFLEQHPEFCDSFME